MPDEQSLDDVRRAIQAVLDNHQNEHAQLKSVTQDVRETLHRIETLILERTADIRAMRERLQ